MAAMMPGGGGGNAASANPYEQYDSPNVDGDDDLIDPDDGEPMPWTLIPTGYC